MHRRRAVVLALLAAAARSVHAIPKEFYSSSSSGVCPKSDLEACPSSLPSGFCCPSGQQCLPLAGLTTALCCPSGRSCEKISPITCDLKLQNPKENPDATVITSVFDVDLEICDNGCCPFGYSCANRVCVRNASQSKKPGEEGGKSSSTTTASASSTAEATSTASTTATDVATLTQTTTATATATSTPDSSSSDADAGKGIKSKTMSIIGGVVGATLVLLILIVVGILCVRRRRKRAAGANPLGEKTGYHRAGSTTSSVRARGLYISEPILQENSYRSDFILKSPSAASSISQRPANSRWSGGGGGGGGGGIGVAPPRIPTPVSNRQQQQQQQQQRREDPEFPNPFASPNPSMAEDRRYSLASSDMFDETGLRTGQVVTGKPAPIRNMRPSSRRISREPQHLHAMADERIDVFSDEYAVPQQQQQQQQYPYQQRDAYGGAKDRTTKMTTFSQLMDKADLGDLYRGKRYVPGSPPRL
ncbi:hypothetical protein MY3957_003032 [Beauveria namnaoensis]